MQIDLFSCSVPYIASLIICHPSKFRSRIVEVESRCTQHNGKPNPPSAINLKGRWFEECGFITGIPVTVTVERGRIIIETQINL
ncbi:hypothetical protein PEC302107_41140 [Pectobacterium araliae]|uniref:SymE family type I addiction module toxin n=1 Tax=Pectobacterium araliae TaxID=3073862 RepID=UPI00207F1CD6|nr:hypothetical protein PEC302110_29800 [Pectobacterium sp. MAFF 302110]GKW22385.1 hypothetical protein PEC302107_41140 [Pectobacterium carotovorum subsp. carotovorum]